MKLNTMAVLPFLALAAMAAGCPDNVRQICSGLQITYDHYDAVAASGVIKASTMQKVAIVRTQTDQLCANPDAATTVSVTALAARAYVVLNAAFKEGGAAPAAQMGYQKTQELRSLLEKARQ